MSAYPDHILRMGSQHLAELKRKAAELERQLWDAHESLEYEVTQSFAVEPVPGQGQGVFDWQAEGMDHGAMDAGAMDGGAMDGGAMDGGAMDAGAMDGGAMDGGGGAPMAGQAVAGPGTQGPATAGFGAAAPRSPEERTADLINHGRHPTKRRHPTARRQPAKRRQPAEGWHVSRRMLLAAIVAAIVVAGIAVLFLILSRPSPAWPSSVAKVQRQIATACQNPDVKAEPSQVNFACARGTRQILWVFSLLTSGNNADYASIKTGRQGLEPITPAQGGEVAWSLNLHHPYNPANPIDSLEVAARAINNIIGGATLTAANGRPVVQPGLESSAANCARYTGSGAVTSRSGFPDRCAKPINSMAGQAYLVADVFQRWVVGAPPSRAQDAAVLFQNAKNPGDPRVRAILRSIQARFPG